MYPYSLVQQFDLEGTFEHRGNLLPVPALVEDEDGRRLLLSGPIIPAEVWAAAQVSGAEGVLRVLGGRIAWATAETFIAYRKENRFVSGFELNEMRWIAVEPDLVRTMVSAGVDSFDSNPFVHLHTHSDFSSLDGYSLMEQIVEEVVADEQRAVAITDHGVCAGHPALRKASDGLVKPIYGMEANFVDNRTTKDSRDYYHLVLWAQTDEGLHNLWALSTEGYQDGFYYRPRIDWESLQRWNTGLLASTACLRGPVLKPYLEGAEDVALTNLARLGEIFTDRLYIELHTNQLEQQIRANGWLIDVAKNYDTPLLAVVDSHYAKAEHKQEHKVWISVQTNKDVEEDTTLFAGDQDYHLMTHEEVRKSLAYLPDEISEKAIANTGALADSCTAQVVPHRVMPIYTRPSKEYPDLQSRQARDAERMIDMVVQNWPTRVTAKVEDEDPYFKQAEYETKLLIDKGFPGYFLMTADYVNWAKENGILVGPGRGSGAASLDAYAMRITEVDPIKTRLLFERFMTEGRTSLPDFDIDFPSSHADDVIGYVQQRWGPDHVARVGTHIRVQNRGSFKETQRAIASLLPGDSFVQVAKISKLVEMAESSTAGLGLSWDELMAQIGDQLDGYRQSMPLLFELAEKFHGRLRTYGKHAAGVIINPDESLVDTLPMRRGGDDDSAPMVTQFDMDALEYLGQIKFDFLFLRNLDTIQTAVDMIEENTGDRINPYNWKDEYEDPQVFEDLSNGWTVGLFQVETSLGNRTTKLIAPRKLEEIADIITLGRPGPMRSGLDKLYVRRRNGEEEVSFPDPRLEQTLSRTFGVMLYQEDIMAVCLVLAGYSSDEADDVRRILGKKKVDQVAKEGEKFILRAVANGTDHDVATRLWDQMAEFAKYCVSGDTKIHLAASNSKQSGTITAADLHRRIHAENGPRRVGQEQCDGCSRPLRLKATTSVCPACKSWRTKFHDPQRGVHGLGYYADERIRPVRILDAIASGEQPTLMIVLADGKFITATPNHRHLTDKGFRRVDELAVGDCLLVDGGYEPQRYESKDRLTRGERKATGSVNGQFGEDNYGFIDGGSVVWRTWREANPKVCAQCGETEGRIEQAHLDGDHTHNDPENYAWLCVSCHKAYDYANNDRRRRWQKGHLVTAVKIVAITDAGVQPTFDIVMEAPHTFVGDGVISHNSFNRGHAQSYATLSYWGAWLKTHYPREFLIACMRTIKKDRIPQFVAEARRLGYEVLPPDINDSREGFTANGILIRYGLEAINGVGAVAAKAVIESQPYSSYEDFIERRNTKCNMGHVRKLVRIGAFDSLVPNRRGLEYRVDADISGQNTQCVDKDMNFVNKYNNLPCHFDWDAEPPKLGKTGKLLKVQPKIPVKCTKGCRHHRPRAPLTFADKPFYSDAEIRDIEAEMLGLYLSSSPFDVITPDVMKELITADDLDVAENGSYPMAAILTQARPDPKGRDFGFTTLTTPAGSLQTIVFRSQWEKFKPMLRGGQLALVEVFKSDQDRYRLIEFLPVNIS